MFQAASSRLRMSLATLTMVTLTSTQPRLRLETPMQELPEDTLMLTPTVSFRRLSTLLTELDSVLLTLVCLFSTLTFPLLPLSTLSSLLLPPTTQNSPLPLSTPVLLPSQLLTLQRLLRPRLLMLLLLKLLPLLLLTGRSVRLTLQSSLEPPPS